jgi:type IV secretory pathway VirB9-like protein
MRTIKENFMRHLKSVIHCVLVLASIVGALAQDSARTVQYHSRDIVAIRAKVKYTTLIELPTTEKIMEAATGDKEFWIVDVVDNFCFVHPSKPGISFNLNLIKRARETSTASPSRTSLPYRTAGRQ